MGTTRSAGFTLIELMIVVAVIAILAALAMSSYAEQVRKGKRAEAVQALGGAGYTKDWPVERYMRDAKLLDIGAGTNEVRRMLIGRELVGA